LEALAQWDQAAACLEHGLEYHSNSVLLLIALANVYSKLRLSKKAEDTFKRAAELDPSSSQSYGLWLQFEGRFEDATAVIERSIELRPRQGLGYFALAEMNRFHAGNVQLVERAIPLLADPKLDPESRMYIHYALGKAYDRSGEYERAMSFFDEGNALAYRLFHSGDTFDVEVSLRYPDKLAKVFGREKLDRHRHLGSRSERPIFVVGMIRSGTTLLDQIITSHPDAASAGELEFWKVEADLVNREWFQNGIDPGKIEGIAQRYLDLLDGVSRDALRVTDKMPINFESVGLMHLVFPSAKFVHIRREPLDTALSMYMTFYGGGPNFAYKKENIVAYYRAYLRFMELWRAMLPAGRLLEVDYEDLVARPEALIRQIVQFCGLRWDDACLSHEGNRNAVPTPSAWQARQPIYQTSVGRWRHYEPWLGALSELRNVWHPQPA
jgi:tetratricopeptide (TPR) repeat protein